MAQPSGRFTVGYTDVELLAPGYEVANPSEGVDPEKHLVGGLFYPSSPGASTAGRTKVKWVENYGHAKGFVHFTLNFFKNYHKNVLVRGLSRAVDPLFGVLAYLLGHSISIHAWQGLEMCKDGEPHPVVLVSHGIGGNRMVHSCICCELASQGFVVMTMEHADGLLHT